VVNSPTGRIDGLDAYRPFLSNFQPIVTGYQIIAAFGKEEDAVLVYDLQTLPVASAIVCDYFTICDGKITQILLIFDQTPFAAAAPPPDAS
jgi:hypothetical protein